MKGLLVDFGGVLTTDVFESFRAFCEREGLDPNEVIRLFREDQVTVEELRRLERGEISEDQFAEHFGRDSESRTPKGSSIGCSRACRPTRR